MIKGQNMEKDWKSLQSLIACFDDLENSTDPAVICGGKSICYHQLIPEAKKLAKAMLLQGLEKGDRVVLSMPYGISQVCAYMAMIYAGIVIVFIDRSWPKDRLAFIQKDCGAGFVLTDEVYASLMETKDEALKDIQLPAIENADAYCIFYTSGSTGNPKGTMVHHTYIYHIVLPVPENTAYFDTYRRCDTVFSMGNIAYGATHGDLLFSLVSGKTLILATDEERLSPTVVGECMLKNHADAMSGTPSMLQRFLEDETFAKAFSALKRLFIIGEALSADVGDVLLKKTPAVIYDAYGASEVGFFAYDRVKKGTPVRLSFPTWQAVLFVADEEGHVLGEGVSGELCIGGCLAKYGYYIGLPELTEQKYFDLPRYGRVYRSGDRAIMDPDGVIRMAGRKDDMQKLHGQRLEPAEVELAIGKYPSVRQAAVQIRGKDKEAVLCAWFSAEEKIEEDGLRRFLADRLPWYMVPARYLQMDELPLNSSGKLDRRAMPDIETGPSDYQVPQTETEALLCRMFGEVLHIVPPVSRNDSFFLLGGDSMQGMYFLSLLAQRKGLRLSMKELFLHPTPEALALICKAHEESKDPVPAQTLSRYEGTLPEEIRRLLGEEGVRSVFPAGNSTQVYLAMQRAGFTQSLNEMRVEVLSDTAWKEAELMDRIQCLVRNHPSLRSFFVSDKKRKSWQVFFETDKDARWEHVWYKDIRNLSEDQAQRFIRGFRQVMDADTHSWKAAYFVLGEQKSVLLLSLSHTIADGISLYTILNELFASDYKDLKEDTLFGHRARLTVEKPVIPETVRRYYSHPDLSIKNKDAMKRTVKFTNRHIVIPEAELTQLKENLASYGISLYTYIQYCYGKALLYALKGSELWLMTLEAGRYPEWGDELRIVGNLTVGMPVQVRADMTAMQFEEELGALRDCPYLSEAAFLLSPEWSGIHEGIISNEFPELPQYIKELTIKDSHNRTGNSMRLEEGNLCVDMRYRDDPETDSLYAQVSRLFEEMIRKADIV
jgi:acyl-coenzyme A synthetase/AMP-(fatty) acid ligase